MNDRCPPISHKGAYCGPCLAPELLPLAWRPPADHMLL